MAVGAATPASQRPRVARAGRNSGAPAAF